ncbi:hypothetical protein D3C78_1775940 [compost metagenome]
MVLASAVDFSCSTISLPSVGATMPMARGTTMYQVTISRLMPKAVAASFSPAGTPRMPPRMSSAM